MADDPEYEAWRNNYDRHRLACKCETEVEDAERKASIELLERVKAETLESFAKLDALEKKRDAFIAAAHAMQRISFWTGFVLGMGLSLFIVLLAFWWSHA